MILVSVIIPVFNADEFLVQCIESIINQTLKEIEIICINDGSTDKSLEILNKYAKNDNRIIIINQDNKGAAFSRNVGIDIATGKYLSFLDADDFFDLDMLNKVYLKAEKTKCDICVFRSSSYNNITNKITPLTYSIRDFLLPNCEVYSPNDIKKDFFKAYVGWAWDKLFNAEFVKHNNLYFQELRTTNDLFFVYSALLIASKITTVNDSLAFHRENNNVSLSHTRNKSSDCFYYALIELKNFMIKNNLYLRYEIDFINYVLNFCLWQLNTMQTDTAKVIYDKLKNKWFDEFKIETLNDNQIYRLKEYKEYQNIKNMTFDEYIKTKKTKTIKINTSYLVSILPKNIRKILYNVRDNGIKF